MCFGFYNKQQGVTHVPPHDNDQDNGSKFKDYKIFYILSVHIFFMLESQSSLKIIIGLSCTSSGQRFSTISTFAGLSNVDHKTSTH